MINRRRFIGSLIGGGALLATGAAIAREPVAGRDYRPLVPRVPTGLPEGRVQVVEVFWYGCPHCYSFEPLVNAWKKTLPEHVEFSHLPATFNDTWARHARVFFAASALDVLEQVHQPFFEALHVQGRNLTSESAILRFIDQIGLDADAFGATMRSPEVSEKIADASLLVQAFQVEGVPSMVVDGRAVISAGMTGSHEAMLEVVDHLIAQAS
jgi:protein dithiol oxidoreductase (disulfide-forming)